MNEVFEECFGQLKDPPVERTKKHLLLDIEALGLCGVFLDAFTLYLDLTIYSSYSKL